MFFKHVTFFLQVVEAIPEIVLGLCKLVSVVTNFIVACFLYSNNQTN